MENLYKNYDLTDDNIDDEIDQLSEALYPLNSDEFHVYDTLPNGFTGVFYEELNSNAWHREVTCMYDKSSFVPQTLLSGEIAVKFKNKFLSVEYKEAL